MEEEKSILKPDNVPETDSTQNGTAGKAASNYDIVIVGAGIAGSSTAIALAPEV